MVRLISLNKLCELDQVSYNSYVRLVKVGLFVQVSQVGLVMLDQ